MKKIINLSYPLSESTPTYGDNGVIELKKLNSITEGDSANKTKMLLDSHIGTHIDFPFHFLQNGKKGEEYSTSEFIYNHVKIINCFKDEGLLYNSDLGDLDADSSVEALIIKTGSWRRRGEEVYWKRSVGLAAETASFLKNKFSSLKLVAFDFISLTSYLHRLEGRQAHKEYLSRDILILEDVDLSQIDNETIIEELILAPFIFENCDGAPCQVIAKIK